MPFRKKFSEMSKRHLRRLSQNNAKYLLKTIQNANHGIKESFLRDLLSNKNIKISAPTDSTNHINETDTIEAKNMSNSIHLLKRNVIIDKNVAKYSTAVEQLNPRISINILDNIEIDNSHTQKNTTENDTLVSANTEKKEKLSSEDFKNKLITWSLQYKVKLNSLTNLLLILRQFLPDYDLPKNGKTLLKTPRKVVPYIIEGEEYIHFGLEIGIKNCLDKNKENTMNCLKLLVGIDGTAYAEKSTQNELWPILGSIHPNREVFLIGCFLGKHKPKSSDAFLKWFINDINKAMCNGIVHNGKLYQVELMAIVCDIPAKAFISKTKGHTGFNSCPKCHVIGRRTNTRLHFSDFNCTLRTDEEIRMQMEDYDSDNDDEDDFVRGRSALLDIYNFGIVSHLPIDYMHLVCIGVTKKILLLWCTGPTRVFYPMDKKCIDNFFLQNRKYTPIEFQRKLIGLDHLGKWKATHFRQFLLYVGVVALEAVDSYDEEMKKLFITLHVAIRLLCSYDSVNDVEYSKHLISNFLQLFINMFGEEYVSANVHGLYHLPDEVLKLNTGLDNFSAFPFENYMRHLKASIRKPEKPLQQIHNRFVENITNSSLKQVEDEKTENIIKGKQHYYGPLTTICRNPQYSKLKINGLTYTTAIPNNCCQISTDIIIIENFATFFDGTIHVIGRKYISIDDLYNEPCRSSLLGIFKVKRLSSELHSWPIENITNKYFRIPIPYANNTFAVLPLIHEH